ncbi:hypothetical protein [Fluviicola taffensis]|uniref:hypothetical protein n=1 Tax=Fluviicola taffensis TaxID=191579 RepID=UPI003137B310
MIRVYLDSDVINKIRNGTLPELAEAINRFRSELLIPFSPAHVRDKLPSKKANEDRFWEDIDHLTLFSQSKHIAYNNKTDFIQPYVIDAKKVAENIEEHNFTLETLFTGNGMMDFLVETATELDNPEMAEKIIKAFHTPTLNENETIKDDINNFANRIFSLRNDASAYKANRELIRDHISIPTDASNWQGDIIDKLDEYVKASGYYESFHQMVEASFGVNEEITRFRYYSQAYQLLGSLGYNPDKIDLKSNKGFDNHLQDAWHSFYGAHCDFFVVMDKRLKAKSQVLYDKYRIYTKIIGPEEFAALLSSLLEKNNLNKLILDTLQSLPVNTLIEDGIHKFLYRLNSYLFGYFTHLQYEMENSDGLTVFLFTKMYDNYSDFIFFQEYDSLIEEVHQCFGGNELLDDVLKKFRSDDTDNHWHDYHFRSGFAQLQYVKGKFYLKLYLLNDQQD